MDWQRGRSELRWSRGLSGGHWWGSSRGADHNYQKCHTQRRAKQNVFGYHRVSFYIDKLHVCLKSGQFLNRARDIKSIDFVETSSTGSSNQAAKQATSTITTVAKKKTRPVAESLAVSSSHGRKHQQSPYDHRTSPKKGFDSRDPHSRGTPRQKYYQKDEDCFDVDVDNFHGKEFDFERNLALFDKRRILEEIESNQPDVVRLIDHNRRGAKQKTSTATVVKANGSNGHGGGATCGANFPVVHPAMVVPKTEPKYRNDQNVLVSEPAQFHQITTEEAPLGEYKTDAGLVVPAISYKLRERFMACAEAKGISRERLVELVARAGTEICIQLLGGSRRLNPQNSHQVPLCVILCGPGKNGEYGLALSRHLATQGVKTVAFFPQLELLQRNVAAELSLYKLCCKSSNSTLIQDVKELPESAVDLVVMALDDHDLWEQERSQVWHRGAIRWCKDLRAPVLAIDPLASPISHPVAFKASLIPGLPLWHDGSHTGKIHMVNLAVPNKVYKDVGITFHSPFGAKSYVTLDPVTA